MRRTGTSSATPGPGGRWRVKLHREVAKVVEAYGGLDADIFRPKIAALIDELEHDPKRFPKKKGALAGARSAPLTFGAGVVWRCVFTLNEKTRSVKVLSLGPHDEAYDLARRRI